MLDEFDTGSESESDIVTKKQNSPTRGSREYGRNSPLNDYSPIRSSLSGLYSRGDIQNDEDKYSSSRNDSFYEGRSTSFSPDSSIHRVSSYNPPSLASEYAADRLNQIRSRLSLGSPGMLHFNRFLSQKFCFFFIRPVIIKIFFICIQ